MTKKKDAGRLAPETGPGERARDDDREAFEQAVQGARPLAADRRRIRGELPPPRAKTARPMAPTTAPPVRLRAIEHVGDAAGDRYAYLAAGESTDRLRELRAGPRPEAVLDLHGQTSVAASGALARFIASARQRDQRVLLLIHGRGHGSGPGGPVLRQQVIQLLTEGALATEVLALASAPPALGGGGAALVLLRRRR